MNILITGGAGFIGSHLARRLLADGHRVTVIDDLSTGSEANIIELENDINFRFIKGNVCFRELVEPFAIEADFIFHLAAAVGVKLIVEKPVQTIETNIHGSEVLFDLANEHGKRIMIASTSEIYGKSTNVPFSESDDTTLGATSCPRWSYACSKMIDEFLALAYHNEYGLETFICRFFNTVGPGQLGQYGMVVPRFVQAALRNEPIEIYGSGEQSRCFCNVSDVVDALCKLMTCDEVIGEVVNIGTTEQVTIKALAERIIELTGSSSEIIYKTYEEAYGEKFDDMMVRMPDLSKANRLIGYSPAVSLDETLREVIEFEKNFNEKNVNQAAGNGQ